MRTPARRIAALASLLVLGACSSGGAEGSASTSSATATATASPTPSPAPPVDPVTVALAGMDRRTQVGQLFVAGVRLDDLAAGDGLASGGVGGIFLAGRSSAAATDLAGTVAGWQSLTPGPRLWVAADQEGGRVQSLRGPGLEPLPSALDQGALPPGELAAFADRMGAGLQSAGINLDLAPVADVVPAGTESANPPIGAVDRQYGSTADVVVAAAGTVIDGLAAHGVTATLKHFPGLGRVQANTDTTADVVDSTTTAGDDQVAAFGTLARSPARPFVMTSSATYTSLDPTTQAVFSPVVVTDLLRGTLRFDGVVITDDVGNAAAVRAVPPGERAVRFLAAGGTLVLTVDAALVPEMIDAVLARSDADPAFAGTVDAAVRTALLAKDRAGLLPG
ncbi:glycoside hydrolase family 3 N-terminal domain-containing protein [Blastococcus sp. CT_GayMR16]|uniref:glycoside hydrolase family 3 N-terminal domain-containing protein n=1 Tax=Blastococcus sp. CT_GayMR16 TaxID=2559607 RepID=UPI001072F47E|nr:glycoside hydrolase family 3 N-terminal domain-containing protein [Blastococcus sp. CT_GayMR16]TFV88737.1 glycoside hydrolase family 3 protein [Blastococcus sp. CT_GayMR16]